MKRKRPTDTFPYFPLYVDRFLNSDTVAKMTTEGVGAYILLLVRAWKQERPGYLENNDESLAAFARVSIDKWNEIKFKVRAAFRETTDGEFIYQPYMVEVWKELASFKKSQSVSGKRGAEARWKRDGDPIKSPLGSPSSRQCDPNGEKWPSTSTSTSKPPLPPEGDGGAVQSTPENPFADICRRMDVRSPAGVQALSAAAQGDIWRVLAEFRRIKEFGGIKDPAAMLVGKAKAGTLPEATPDVETLAWAIRGGLVTILNCEPIAGKPTPTNSNGLYLDVPPNQRLLVATADIAKARLA